MLLCVIYSLNLSYPKELRYKVFQKLFLELNGLKRSSKVLSLKNRLMSLFTGFFFCIYLPI
uniref:Uncharacterized protein n=1 Tax=Erpetoichthys calabaricus TaxID=27687 RepID=A0A8C4RI98_ERPCA